MKHIKRKSLCINEKKEQVLGINDARHQIVVDVNFVVNRKAV